MGQTHQGVGKRNTTQATLHAVHSKDLIRLERIIALSAWFQLPRYPLVSSQITTRDWLRCTALPAPAESQSIAQALRLSLLPQCSNAIATSTSTNITDPAFCPTTNHHYLPESAPACDPCWSPAPLSHRHRQSSILTTKRLCALCKQSNLACARGTRLELQRHRDETKRDETLIKHAT